MTSLGRAVKVGELAALKLGPNTYKTVKDTKNARAQEACEVAF